jgi:hypothetical protein
MKLVALPDGVVGRVDRALWLSLLFDLLCVMRITPGCRIYTVAAEDRVLEVDCG